MFHALRQTSTELPPHAAPVTDQYELMQMTLNRIMLDTLVAMGVDKGDLMARLRDAASNLNMSANQNAAVGIEMLTRQLRAA